MGEDVSMKGRVRGPFIGMSACFFFSGTPFGLSVALHLNVAVG